MAENSESGSDPKDIIENVSISAAEGIRGDVTGKKYDMPEAIKMNDKYDKLAAAGYFRKDPHENKLSASEAVIAMATGADAARYHKQDPELIKHYQKLRTKRNKILNQIKLEKIRKNKLLENWGLKKKDPDLKAKMRKWIQEADEEKLQNLHQSFRILSSSTHFRNGFRAPYLSRDNNLSKILAETNFEYDSSYSTFSNYPIKNKMDVQRVLKFYDSSKESFKLPYIEEGIVQIPLNLPDDQILVDIENFSSPLIFKVWRKILLKCIKENTIFVLQLHPERFHLVKESLVGLLVEADKYKIWKVNMHEISEHFKQYNKIPEEYCGGLCITGDIDVLTLEDYFLMYGN